MTFHAPVLRPRHRSRARARFSRAVAAVVAVLAIGVGVIAPTAASADASSSPSISLEALTPSTQQSGTAFGYKATYECSNVNITACATGPTLTIPLGAAAAWPVQVGASADITSWSVSSGSLVIHLVDLVEGDSGTIGITITPPNHTTPNGTTWTLVPTMTFTDGTPTATAPGVTSTATAVPSLSVTKSAEQTFYKPGDTVPFTIFWDCPNTIGSTGDENLAALHLVDTLPAGLTYASSSPAGAIASGQTVTFDLTPAQLGDRCSAGSGDEVSVIVRATVDAGVADNTVLTNSVAASAQSISGATRTASSSANITVVRTFPGATAIKQGYGPLLNSVGDGSRDLNLNGYRSATYPGPWLGRGLANKPTSWVSSVRTDSAEIEAVYMLYVTLPTSGLQNSVVDPMPCTTNQSGAAYSSNAPGDLCQTPAFHATMLTVWARTSENSQNVGVPDAFTPQARLTDGTLVALTPGPVPADAEALANGPGYRSYFVPASAIGRVAELVFPRTAGMTNARTNYAIGGYADADRQGGDILKNRASISSYVVGDSAPYATTTSPIGNIYVLEGPQIGLTKFWSPTGKEFQLNAETFFRGPTSGDLTFVDTLPAGIAFAGPAAVSAYTYTSGWKYGIPATVTVTTDPATGQSVVTVRITAAAVSALLPSGGLGDRVRFEIHLPSKIAYPGNYTNTATVNLSDPTVRDAACTQGTKVVGSAGAGFTCSASRAFTINPDPTSDAVRVSKSVKGSLDDTFKTNPAIGHIGAAGGSATYRLSWTNKSVQSLGNVVAYDLLPRVSDTGTVAGTLTQQRGSTFRPSLTGVSALPAGVSGYYSTSTNPCRPEVLPNAQNAGCTDDWVALPPMPSTTLLDSVRALRFVSTGTYAFDTGFSVDLSMTTPPLESAADIAWNTFATAQTNLTSGQALPPVESAKVGIARPDFSHITIDKVVDKATAHVGDTLTYTVSAINDGGRDLSDVTLRDRLPEGMTFVSASNGGTYADGEVTWDLSTMPLGQQYTFTITAKATVADGSTLVNRWGVDGTTPVTPLHPCPAPNTADESCATTTIPAVALTYAKTSDPAPGTAVKAGDTITYTVTATNPTADASTSGKATDDMSDVLDKATLTAEPTLTCAPTTGPCGEVAFDEADKSFVWTSSPAHPLAGNTQATITYTVKVQDDATGTVGNVLVEPGITVEHPIIVGGKTVDKGAKTLVGPGETLTYTLTVRNTGTDDAATATASDDLTDVVGNADLVPGSIISTPGTATYDADAQRLVWTGPLAAGSTATITYSVVVRADAHGELRNPFLGTTVVNPVSGSLQWRKVDDDAEPKLLSGAEWSLTPLDGEGDASGDPVRIVDCVAAPCSGADTDPTGGQFLVDGLEPGKYRLVEVAAPDGFVRNDTPIAVTVGTTAQVTTIDDVVNHPVPTSTPTPTPSPSSTPSGPATGPKTPGISGLPITGIDGAFVLSIGAVALGAVLIGTVLMFVRRRNRADS